jgi:hypothetical protein
VSFQSQRPTDVIDRPAVIPPPPRSRLRKARVPLIILTALAVSTGTAIAGSQVFRSTSSSDARTTVTVPVSEDGYTFAEFPDAIRGTNGKLVASSMPGNRKVTYLKFRVGNLPSDASEIRAAVRVTRDDHHLSAPVAISSVASSAWSEKTLTARNAPAVGTKLVEVATSVSTRTVTFPIGGAIARNGIYTFAITSDSRTAWASFRSREFGSDAPTLVLSYGRGGTAPAPTVSTKPSASASASPTAKPSASPTASPKPSPTGTAPAPAPIPAGATQCGASFLAERAGETRAAQLDRIDGYYNGLEMVRVFYTTPPAWTNVLDTDNRTISISFKYPPREVATGKHDAYLANWFKTAPRTHRIYWTFYHEPEDNIAKGEFTAADYRAAWTRLRKLADAAGNSQLKATLILMDWTVDPLSGRNWRDYYAGKSVIQVLGWDAYNAKAKTKGIYSAPSEIFSRPIQVSRAEGLPFAIPETGSHLVTGDSGAQRAAWVRSMAKYLTEQGALYVAYFDVDWSNGTSSFWSIGDFRLRDTSGMAAWREFCS